ncbi:MAG: 6-bladed beta-propeller [Phycisphaerales bacterium]
MKPTSLLLSLLACLFGLFALAGCGAPAGPILTATAASQVWPAPPDPARFRYLGELRTDRDLKPARRGLARLGDTIFGKAPDRTMMSPLAVCTDDADRVFVADSNGRAVHVFDLVTREYKVWTPPPPGFGLPVALAFDPAGRLLVSDAASACVWAFDRAGKPLGKLGVGALVRPCGVAVLPDGSLIVADVGAHQLVVLSASGAPARAIGLRGSAPGEFNFPTHLAVDGAGRVYVSDSLNFRVQVFDADLRPVLQFGRKGDLPGYFAQPKGITVDPGGNIYVVDANFEAVQVFDSSGALLMSMGREGSGPGDFWLPSGAHFDQRGRLWIADSYNRRVQAFELVPQGDQP